MTLPAGITQDTFNNALRAFEKAIGTEWVFSKEEDVKLYRDAYSPFGGETQEYVASAAVAPGTAEEVQEVVRIANKYRIPLYAISTGKNLGYGGAAPSYSGSVVVDLKRLNRIIEVDESQAYCIVEPGVSYFDLYEYLQEHKLKLWIDCPEPGWGSLVGNALDRGAGYTSTRFRNHFDAHCGMEVVLPNGELMRTGMGALPESKTWGLYKTGFGPWVDGMFSQSNFGIVTKMGFWLMPEPEAVLRCTVDASQLSDLDPMITLMTKLENMGVFNGYPDFFSPVLGNPGLEGLHKFMVNGPSSADPEFLQLLQRGAKPEEYEPYAIKNKIPFWRMVFTFYGPKKVIEAQWEHTQERFREVIPNAKFNTLESFTTPLTDADKAKVEFPAMYGIPNLRGFIIGTRSNWSPAPASDGHIGFSPIIPRRAEEVIKINQVLGEAARKFNVPLPFAMNAPVPSWERSFTFVILFWISKDPEVNKRTRAAFEYMVRKAAENGWGEYRTPVAFQDLVMDTYSFNNHALLRFHETVKDAIDPNGILSPGRYGIWPKHLRDTNKKKF